MKILIKNGRVVDPDTRLDGVMDLLIVDDRIARTGNLSEEKADQIMDASGCYEIGRASGREMVGLSGGGGA